jgi:hypothetical protein
MGNNHRARCNATESIITDCPRTRKITSGSLSIFAAYSFWEWVHRQSIVASMGGTFFILPLLWNSSAHSTKTDGSTCRTPQHRFVGVANRNQRSMLEPVIRLPAICVTQKKLGIDHSHRVISFDGNVMQRKLRHKHALYNSYIYIEQFYRNILTT